MAAVSEYGLPVHCKVKAAVTNFAREKGEEVFLSFFFGSWVVRQDMILPSDNGICDGFDRYSTGVSSVSSARARAISRVSSAGAGGVV
jgi:hypothetical protein